MSNLGMLHVIAKGLDYLLPEVVFVGGAVAELYASDAAASEVRPTNDVDCVIELFSYSKFAELENQLRNLKFVNDTESNVICRWDYAGIKVDIMPNDESILGFSNIWYKEGMSHTLLYSFDDGIQIRYFETAYFLASKFVALINRGGSDLRSSSDFEDIIYILDNRLNLISELKDSGTGVIASLNSFCKKLLQNGALEEVVACALPLNSEYGRVMQVIDIIKIISELNTMTGNKNIE
ncbi:MAG: hypothetical protein GZ094_00295 [Mariniphaga sp.]|nr:hypothetical protein [Mariniphaga sp.]